MAERGRPRRFDRDVALEAAMRVFWRAGYQGASIADLTAAMGIAAPSLYAAFGDKRALYAEALGLYEDKLGPTLWGRLEAAPTAREGIEAVLNLSAAALTRDDRPNYCMVVLADAGGDGSSDPVRAGRDSVLQTVTRRLQRAVAEGELPASVDPAALARFYTTVQQGLSIQARDGASAEDLRAVGRHAMAAWPGREPPPSP